MLMLIFLQEVEPFFSLLSKGGRIVEIDVAKLIWRSSCVFHNQLGASACSRSGFKMAFCAVILFRSRHLQ